MASTYKVLGQKEPAINTNEELYTVPAATQAVVSTISVCNRVATPQSFRIMVRPGGASLVDAHYIVYDAPIAGNDTLFLTVGLTLAATDRIDVRADTADMAFNAYGSEIT